MFVGDVESGSGEREVGVKENILTCLLLQRYNLFPHSVVLAHAHQNKIGLLDYVRRESTEDLKRSRRRREKGEENGEKILASKVLHAIFARSNHTWNR